ncbi:hypothetical protein GCM10023215_45500 [Pseudonocardia yuanmonensis]|uniref:Uncharacterized protein n=1 Tax=Pseudonocardia yuanmonensis TaxID=1095914 RepID=A0ABP8X970_9PSEU
MATRGVRVTRRQRVSFQPSSAWPLPTVGTTECGPAYDDWEEIVELSYSSGGVAQLLGMPMTVHPLDLIVVVPPPPLPSPPVKGWKELRGDRATVLLTLSEHVEAGAEIEVAVPGDSS